MALNIPTTKVEEPKKEEMAAEKPVQSIAPVPAPAATPVPVKGGLKSKDGELSAIISAMRKQKGDSIAVTGRNIPSVLRIPTGVFEFDLATGGGFPRGRYSIIYGPESSGKTNLAYKAIASAQRMPAPCNKAVLIDLEGTFDPAWASQFGIDVDELIVLKPGYGEEAGDLCDAVLRAEDVAVVVLDSLAVMVSSKEVEQSLEKFDVGTSALLVKRLVNKVVGTISEEGKRGHYPALIFINQTRMKIGVMFGNPETMPGGQAMKFLASLIIRVSGKNTNDKAVNADMPTFKETSAVIKKAKVPVTKYEFNYDMVMYAHNGLGVGDTKSWNLVSNHLKQVNELKKHPKGWELLGKVYPTLSMIEDMYQAEPEFMSKLQGMVIDSMKGSAILIGSENE